MTETKTLDEKLAQVVYSEVKRETYPPLPEQVSDADIRKTHKDLKAGTVARPKTKTEYVALLASLEHQIKDIEASNKAAQEKYAADRAAVDKDFEAKIQAAKEDEGNQWAAIRLLRDQLLRECDWVVLSDSPVSASIDQWKTYRQALRDIPQTYKRPADVVWPEAPA